MIGSGYHSITFLAKGMEIFERIKGLCQHAKHPIACVIVLRSGANKAHFLIQHQQQDANLVNPFMALVAHSVSTFRGMEVAKHETELRRLPIRPFQDLTYADDDERLEHANRMRQVLSACEELSASQEGVSEFMFFLIDAGSILEQPQGLLCKVWGVPGRCVGLLRIHQIWEERVQ